VSGAKISAYVAALVGEAVETTTQNIQRALDPVRSDLAKLQREVEQLQRNRERVDPEVSADNSNRN
jgi:hypothetical protein